MPETIVSPDWLADHRREVAVVDVRREWEYDEGAHIPTAVNVPFDEFRDPTDETLGKLPTSRAFAAVLGDAGIGPEDRIVAYDDEFGVYASRFLVTAEVFGHDFDRLSLLNGDIETWAGEYKTEKNSTSIEPTAYDCTRPEEDPLVSAQELEAALDTDTVIVDTRDPIEYDTVHLPNAVNVQWQSLVDTDKRTLLPNEELSAVLADHGIVMDRPVRLYCNTARRLSFLYAILRHLGHEDVAVYEGGIDTWADSGGPVATT